MEFRLLGAVSVATEAGELPLGPAKRRSVLAALLLRPNTAVPVDQLIDAIWDEAPPAHARTVVQGHVSRLRALLNDGEAAAYGVELTTQGRAYVLEMSESLLDAYRFEELVLLARTQRQAADAVLMFREALSLWRGPALTGTVSSEPLLAAAHALEETRLVTVEDLAEAYSELGEHGRAAAVLRAEAVAHPMRESLSAALMLALYRAGRQSDALDWYHRTRHLLADELGVDPGRALQTAYGAILQGDPFDPPAPETWAPAPSALHLSAPLAPSTSAHPASAHLGASGTPHRNPADSAHPDPGGAVHPGGSAPAHPGSVHPGGSAPAHREPTAPAHAATTTDPGPVHPGAPHREPVGSPAPALPSPWARVPPGAERAGTGEPVPPPTDAPAPRPTPAPDAVLDEPGPAPVPPQKTPPALPGAPAPSVPHVPADPTAPDLLPRHPRGFLARTSPLTALTRIAATPDSPIALITGPAGVGKTALALHWAHHHRDAFPGGLLFADLHGFDALPAPEPADVIREFLLALGVARHALPETPATAAALYRRLTAGRRLLVVLDNARSSAQVRPLLPAGDTCVTLVTSRNRLGGLIADDLARPVPLDVLDTADSVALLATVLGEERVAAEPDAARALAARCDGLPLALRITAARLATLPDRTLARHADELADERGRLALLAVEDRGVEAELRLSLSQLDASTQRVFRGLGAHTGPTVDSYAAAALAGVPVPEAAAALERLCGAHLVQEHGRPGGGRYALHDLVRLFARTTADDPAALPRLLDYYVCAELAANAVAEPGSRPCCSLPDDVRKPSRTPRFAQRSEVIEWYAAEREALAGALAAARTAGLDDRVWRLAILQWPYILWRARDGWTPLLRTALEAAVAVDDPRGESRVRALLGWVLVEEERTEEAHPHLESAPVLAARAGDPVDEAIGRINLSLAQRRRGDLDAARSGCVRALELARQAEDVPTELLAGLSLAELCLQAGDPAAALRYADAGLALGPHGGIGQARKLLLSTVRGEALTLLGQSAEGLAVLRDAAVAAERDGYHEGACRALAVLLKHPGAEAYEDRHARAAAALAAETGRGHP
ncbi:AfsR/SARP family transcriptional regulator [Streptomyces sp. NPDC088745]|uniref:AfsR/SARP family transcriptional regulator n=1 Tax=Streptomyces sp. NPDC088745 TaxID=3365884 RepID=UPI003814ED8D